jgi:hypothetical protein
MAGKSKNFYTPEILKYKKSFFDNLPEKQRRHFLGLEYLQLGANSQRYLSRVFDCSRITIVKGKEEVSSPDFTPDYSFQRIKGGGNKKKSRP